MNAILNQKLIDDIANKPRLTELVLKAFALRVLYLRELNEADVTDAEQELEIEEIMDFFDGHKLSISEHKDGTIVFHTKGEAPVISLRKTVPDNVIAEFIGGVWFDPNRDWAVVAESLTSVQYYYLDELVKACREFVFNIKRFNHWVQQAREMPMFKPYFLTIIAPEVPGGPLKEYHGPVFDNDGYPMDADEDGEDGPVK